MLRKFVVALAIAGMITATTVKPSHAMPAHAPATAASMAGLYFPGALIIAVAGLCFYDLYLKMNGYKNWDGTPLSAPR
jgi:hypothetical protein